MQQSQNECIEIRNNIRISETSVRLLIQAYSNCRIQENFPSRATNYNKFYSSPNYTEI